MGDGGRAQHLANRSTFIAMGLLLVLLLIRLVGDWSGLEGIVLFVIAFAVAMLHLPLGIVAVVAAWRSGQVQRNLWIYGYFSVAAVVTLSFLGVSQDWGRRFESAYERITQPETVALRESLEANGVDPERAAEAIAAGADVETRGRYQRTPLMLAAGLGNLDLVTRLLEANADARAQTGDGATALHLAAGGESSPEVIDALVRAGAEIDARDQRGMTPLMSACVFGRREPVTLLAEAGADLLARSASGQTCLLLAVENDDRPFVEWLLESARQPLDTGGALTRAALDDHQELFVLLLERGADPAVLIDHPRSRAYELADDRRDNRLMFDALRASGRSREAFAASGYAELSYGARSGTAQTMKNLLALGLDPDAANDRGGTSLHTLARGSGSAREEKARVLIDAGAEIDAVNASGSTPLFDAAIKGNLEMVQLLLERGADVDFVNQHGSDAMLQAAQGGYGYIIDELIAAGFELPPPEEHGRYLITARRYGTGVRALLALGMDPNRPDDDGDWPLFEAISYGDKDAVAALVEGGANLQQLDRRLYSPLTAAAERNRHEALAVLLAAGMDPNAKDGGGRTALGIAIKDAAIDATIALVRGGAHVSAADRDRIEQGMLGDAYRGKGRDRQDELRASLGNPAER